MQYFDAEFLQFFRELAANNHKEWFDANRKRYEKKVKEPFKQFIGDLIAEVHKLDPTVGIEPKDAIFRINRDIRFSKDKSPYKLNTSAVVSSVGRKDHSVPGLYVDFGPEKVWIGGGAYFLKPDQLMRVREYIVSNNDRFNTIVKDKNFVKHYKEIRGEENKRLPKQFQQAGEEQPLLYKKQLYYMSEHAPETVEGDKLMSKVLAHFKAGRDLQDFLKAAMG